MVDFLVIGPETIVQYNNVFQLIKDKKICLGFKRDRGHMFFQDYDDIIADVPNIRWWQTLMDVPPPEIELNKSIGDGYKKFDDCDIINVDEYKSIPTDYDGLIGVPITFYRYWNSDQFELVDMKKKGCIVEGEQKFVRLIIKRKKS